jgi:hypothetical protein
MRTSLTTTNASPVDTCNIIRTPVDTCNIIRIPVDTCNIIWIPVDTCNIIRIPVDTCNMTTATAVSFFDASYRALVLMEDT